MTLGPMTALMITQLNNSNMAMQRSQAGTRLGNLSPAGFEFFVDENAGDDDNDGSAWGSAFASLTFALAASTTAIGSEAFGWTARNKIYVKGDALTEDLVLLAPKTDVIGVGSADRFPYARLIGNHVPTGATCSFGTRFYNFMFKTPAAGGDMWTLDDDNAWLEFGGCRFSADSTTASTGAIVTAASTHLRIHNNTFLGKFSDSVIEIGTGDARGLDIGGNYIEGSSDGIELGSGATDSAGATEQLMNIYSNRIISTTIGINDASGLAYINENRVYTDNAKGSVGAGAIVGSVDRGQDNRITTSDANNVIWPAEGAL